MTEPTPPDAATAAHTISGAVQLHRQGNTAQAESLYLSLLNEPSVRFDALHMLGVLKAQQGRPSEALELLRAALSLQPGHVVVMTNLGPVLAALGRHAEALAIYDRALAAQPDLRDGWNNRGNALMRLGRAAEALQSFDRAIALDPDYAEAHDNRRNALQAMSQPEETLTSQGNALAEQGRFEEALESYDQALLTHADQPELLNVRGTVLRRLKRPGEALESFERALMLRPTHLGALNNRANALRDLDRLDDATAGYEAALARDAGLVEAWIGLGAIHLELRRVDQAVACFDRAVALSPDYPEARLNRALARLFAGDFAAAHEDYEHRWRVKVAPPNNGLPGIPAWNGEHLRHRRIVIYEEQGLGDIIQFFRFLPRLLAQGADVSFLVRRPLHRLFAPYAATIHLLDAPPPGASFDYQCALMSLPGVMRTTRDTTPADAPYLFAEPALAAKWRARLGERGVKIGLCWQGSPRQPIDIGRSIPLRLFAPLAAIPGVRLISLQRNHGLDALSDLPSGMQVETLGPDFDTCPGFEETAAVIASLDLVISCDTSVAHLAGALGRPVWIALKYASEWRWQHDRTDSIWYPTARLYRQAIRTDWRPVLHEMATDAARLFAEAGPRGGPALGAWDDRD